jgi:hypothetical protein
MDVLDYHLEQKLRELDELMLPSTLLDCFEIYRKGQVEKAASCFNHNELSWFLDSINRLRGVADQKDELELVFDPMMYTVGHPSWELPPGRRIDVPPLNSEVLRRVSSNATLAVLAKQETSRLLELTDSYMDEDIFGFARIAAAALCDGTPGFADRWEAVRYLAIHGSSQIEDYWVKDDTLWEMMPVRRIELPDIVEDRKQALLQHRSADPLIQQVDLECYAEDEVKNFAFDTSKLLLSGKGKHLALCGRCQNRIRYWIDLADESEKKALREGNGALPQA